MGRPSTIESHERFNDISHALDRGDTLTEVSSRFGVSVQALSRWNISRKSQLAAQLDDDALNVPDLLQRLTDVADDARLARRESKHFTPAARSRAIEAESRVLAGIIDRLGIDDLTISDALTVNAMFTQTVAAWVQAEPEHSRSLVRQLQRHDHDQISAAGNTLAARLPEERR
ncbi:LysM peptidoglycan-binding domain-containing protein [Agromyces sp. CF514]|uniref:LysM peptidoglycan-binding domain-containing protein n=1 Tax=Agromyces sp. CF514 TaxID=1881031 RepID=UPI000B89785A|nr:LysM domain-containing protein [Agromyces sp. CF514]